MSDTVIQIRKAIGNFAENVRQIDVKLDFDDTLSESGIKSVLHTISSDRDSDITHGGGATPGQWLHYKSTDVDADSDGDIDYSLTRIYCELSDYGDFRVQVKAKITYDEIESTESVDSDSWTIETFVEEEVTSNEIVFTRSEEVDSWV